MDRNQGFLIGPPDDSEIYVQWGAERANSLPCTLDDIDVAFGLEITLQKYHDQAGFLIGVAVEIHSECQERAAKLWAAIRDILDEGARDIGIEVTEDTVIEADVEAESGLVFYSRDTIIPPQVEDLIDALLMLQSYTCFVYRQMNRLGWIKPRKEGE